jgi:hypothetical protein
MICPMNRTPPPPVKPWSGRSVVPLAVFALSIVAGCGHRPETITTDVLPLCVPQMEKAPPLWRPPSNLSFPYAKTPWQAQEQRQADLAVHAGLEEMATFMVEKPARVVALGDNAIEAFIDTAYAAGHTPALEKRALTLAFDYLDALSKPYRGPKAIEPICDVVGEYLTFAVYAHSLAQRMPHSQKAKDLRADLVIGSNAALAACGDLKTLLGFDPQVAMAVKDAKLGDVYHWVMWSITFVDTLTNPDLKMPPGTDEFIAETWRYLATYTVPLAKDYPNGLNHMPAYDAAYLMTHVAYIPTGYGRHQLSIADAPWLYRYIRENYYAALALGELDLFAEFVDLLRQYGCTEQTDAQLRHGSRYLLHLYGKAGDRWLAHRESYESKDISDYDALHKPWTAIAGLRRRVFEAMAPGSYGHAFRQAIRRHTPPPQKKAADHP